MKSIAVYNLKGGVGKTTTAVHLAHLLARSGVETLLWDLDAQGAASWVYRVRVAEGLRPERLLERSDELLGAIRASDWPGLDVLPADFSLLELEKTLERRDRSARALESALGELGRHYRRVVLDCPPALSPLAHAIFGSVDALLVPTITTPLSLRALAGLYQHLKPFRKQGLLVLPFFSMVDGRKATHRRVIEFAQEAQLGFLATQVPYSAHIENATVRRTPLSANGSHPKAELFDALLRELEEHLALGQPKLHRSRLERFLEQP